MVDAFFPDQATIWIGTAATNLAVSAIVSTANQRESNITNYSESGGAKESESIPVFGGGNITKENPRDQLEVSFDVVIVPGASSSVWDGLLFGTSLSSATDAADAAIAIQWAAGTNYYSRAYNNARGVSFDPESSADDLLRGTISFKLSPTTPDGTANLRIKQLQASTITFS